MLDNERDYVVLKGAFANSYQVYPAVNTSANTINIPVITPNKNIAVSRLVYQQYVFNITVTGTNSTLGPLLIPGFFGPRSLPLHSIMSSLVCNINDDTITQANIYAYDTMLRRFHNKFDYRNFQESLTPTMLDQFQDYSLGAGSVRNPLSNYVGDDSFEDPRGAFYGLVVTSNPNQGTSATLQLTVYEPIRMSPFVFDKFSNYESCFIGVQNLNYIATFVNTQRVLSIVPNPVAGVSIDPVNGISVSIAAANLIVNYLTPDPTEPLPKSISYNYFSPVYYPQIQSNVSFAAWNPSTTPLNQLASQALVSASIQLSGIPRRIYLWARGLDSSLTAATSDCFLSLPSSLAPPLKVTLDNLQLLTTTTSYDLYNISVKNGLNMSANQFFRDCGSIICLDFGTDLALSDSAQAPSVLGTHQLQITCNFVNTNSVSSVATAQMNILIIAEGTFNINGSSTNHMLSVLTSRDVIDARMNPNITYKEVESIYGGDFFKSLKSGLSKVGSFIKDNIPRAHQLIKDEKLLSKLAREIPHPYAQVGSKVLDRLGYGGQLSGDNVYDRHDIRMMDQ